MSTYFCQQITLLSLFCLLSTPLLSQIEKGKILLGGTVPISGGFEQLLLHPANNAGISFTTTTDEGDDKTKITTLGFSPMLGYAIADNLLLGAGIQFVNQKAKHDRSDSESSTTIFSFGPQIRYYFAGTKVRPFVEAAAAFGTIKNSFSGSGFDDDDSSSIQNYSAKAGAAVFLNELVSLDLSLGYEALEIEGAKQNALGLGVGFSWFL